MKRVESEDTVPYAVMLPKPFDEDQAIAIAVAILDSRLRAHGEILSDPNMVQTYLRGKLQHQEREVFAVLLLDTRHRLLSYQELFFGTVDGAEVHPREIVKAALLVNATAVVMVHNHPSGNPEPSAADRAVTARVKQGLALVDIRLLDHFIVAGDQVVSLAAKGWV